MSKGWKPTLKYSPVNGIIVDWGLNGVPFSMCCMPQPVCPGEPPVPPEPTDCGCGEQPMPEAVDTYDWHRWVPEIIVGIEDAVPEMAAAYARQAAIEFARKTRVLKRQVALELLPGVRRYPLEAFEDESVQGILRIESSAGVCGCESEGGIDVGIVKVNVAKQEIEFAPTANSCGSYLNRSGPKHLLVTVWAAPTEESCQFDVFLYEQYRREITLGARAWMIRDAHAIGSYKTQRGYANYRGDQFMASRAAAMEAEFRQILRQVRRDAALEGAIQTHQPGALFGSGCCYISARR